MPDSKTLIGRVTAPGYTLPGWAQDHLHLFLWDRDEGPEQVMLGGPLAGPDGTFALTMTPEAALKMAMVGHREGPQHVASIGWSQAGDPILANLPWPLNWGSAKALQLGWDGTVTVTGYVEQLHIQEFGGIPLAVLEVAGRAIPLTYRRLPPLPQASPGDRHGLHADRPLEDTDEQVYYLLADAETPLAAIAQDALVSNLQIVGVASLGAQEGGWHDLVNLPLVLDQITLIGP